ncbi:Uu.00g128350.m01.CDS01 [Anthostomella pinea]|uniref:Uu.00g128350.m01.CDS01 n=1 Tax=Anthostomella pinea TaxID=933095 RepID=A0AAI8VJ12_9PEZI|nr:Uu.00g128350.m01.CDS01 [Anthostomella pinea]
MKPNERFRVDEYCLYVTNFATSNVPDREAPDDIPRPKRWLSVEFERELQWEGLSMFGNFFGVQFGGGPDDIVELAIPPVYSLIFSWLRRMPDTLACLRSVPAASFLAEDCQFNAHLDDLIREPILDAFADGNTCAFSRSQTYILTRVRRTCRWILTTVQALESLNNQAYGALFNAVIVPLTMEYWTWFVKTLDPNAMRLEGAREAAVHDG